MLSIPNYWMGWRGRALLVPLHPTSSLALPLLLPPPHCHAVLHQPLLSPLLPLCLPIAVGTMQWAFRWCLPQHKPKLSWRQLSGECSRHATALASTGSIGLGSCLVQTRFVMNLGDVLSRFFQINSQSYYVGKSMNFLFMQNTISSRFHVFLYRKIVLIGKVTCGWSETSPHPIEDTLIFDVLTHFTLAETCSSSSNCFCGKISLFSKVLLSKKVRSIGDCLILSETICPFSLKFSTQIGRDPLSFRKDFFSVLHGDAKDWPRTLLHSKQMLFP